jgi:CDP-diacylglycerol pyrophosphatase
MAVRAEAGGGPFGLRRFGAEHRAPSPAILTLTRSDHAVKSAGQGHRAVRFLTILAGMSESNVQSTMGAKRPGRVVLWGVLLLAGIALAVATASLADPFGRDALRGVVAACEISKRTLGISFPCNEVNLGSPASDGYVTIHSPGFASEFLLAPLADYDGIESDGLLADSATGLWHAAWAMRNDVAAALGREVPRNGLALAVNASGTRTQDHFHIHLDCLRGSVGRELAGLKAEITEDWARMRQPLRGNYYWGRTIASADLGGINIARLVADAPPAHDHPMGHVTLALVPETLRDGSDGFFLLANWQNLSAEALLDHHCRDI